MASLSDLPLKYRVFVKAYPYRRVDWSPGSVLTKPLPETRVAVVTTAGLYRPTDTPFDDSIRGGDTSYRVIPYPIDLDTLQIGHSSEAFDPSGIERDKNVALPLDRLHDLAREHMVGSLAPRHFSFMGSITAPGRLISQTGPEVAAMLRADGVEAVLLTPV
ncbi:MAG TPA: glycine/sarcosine/betaine reductase selenoprotein B family protein [Vicinamibacterales bacterium]|jgi:D-proline reductase (dithiol) PrdB|nr:glycine/sarcosine/betaine reductase selenoprotein B family protein [Vicinamibacterales bacterium]